MADTVQLDPFDIQILRQLCADGRISVQDLSDRIGLTPPTPPTARAFDGWSRPGG